MNKRLIFQLFFACLVLFFLGQTIYSLIPKHEKVEGQKGVEQKPIMAPNPMEQGHDNHDPDNIMDEVDRALAQVNGGHDKAIKLLDHILSHQPRHSYAIRLKANLLSQSQRYNESAQGHKQYLLLHPNDMRAMLSYGKQLVNLKRWSDAITPFESVHEAHPSFGPVHELLSKTYRALGHQERAVEIEKKYKKLKNSKSEKSLPLMIHPKYLFREEGEEGVGPGYGP